MNKPGKTLALALALLLLGGLLAGCAQPGENPGEAPAPTLADGAGESAQGAEGATRIFTDSVGREVEVPQDIRRVAISGPLAQIIVFALAPDRLVGIASQWDPSAEAYLDTEYYQLPLLGQLYGGKGEMNLETLLASGAQIVIDVGEPKDTLAADLDALQAQTGLPFVHISAYVSSMEESYRMLGDLLGMEAEAEALAQYCAAVYDRALAIAEEVEKASILYITGDAGLNVIARGSYHGEIIDLLADNLAVVDSPSSKGTGNEVDMEQILNWDPDVILFAPESIYAQVGGMEEWQGIAAIQNGRYYEVPLGPYNWMGFPPSVQRLLGMMWLEKLLYPQAADYDLYQEVAGYFERFYHCTLSRAQFDALMKNSLGWEAGEGAA